jgi:hypothetical protein
MRRFAAALQRARALGLVATMLATENESSEAKGRQPGG